MSEVIFLYYVNSYSILRISDRFKNSQGVVFLYQTKDYLNITVYIKNIPNDIYNKSITLSIGNRLYIPLCYDNGKIKVSITTKDYSALDFVDDEVNILLDDEVIASGVIIKDVRNYDYHYSKPYIM